MRSYNISHFQSFISIRNLIYFLPFDIPQRVRLMKVVFSMNNAKEIISRRNVAMEDAFAALKCHQLLTKTEPSNAKV